MRVFRETTLDDFSISKITKKAITKNGINEPTLIAVNLEDQDLEILFEVESTADEHHKVDLKGNEKDSDRGYAVVLRFKNLRDVIDEDKLTRENLPDVLTDCDVVVHCDCPSFYYQGLQQDDSINNNARYKFQGTAGNHQWSLIHSKAGGKTGKALCKHLESVKEWLEDSKNAVEEIANKLQLNEVFQKRLDIRKQFKLNEDVQDLLTDWIREINIPNLRNNEDLKNYIKQGPTFSHLYRYLWEPKDAKYITGQNIFKLKKGDTFTLPIVSTTFKKPTDLNILKFLESYLAEDLPDIILVLGGPLPGLKIDYQSLKSVHTFDLVSNVVDQAEVLTFGHFEVKQIFFKTIDLEPFDTKKVRFIVCSFIQN